MTTIKGATPADQARIAAEAGELARSWIEQLEAAEAWQRPWRDQCRKIIRRYKNELLRATDAETNNEARRFAILWANNEVLRPAVYARPPQANCSRRFKDEDPVGRYAAEVLERGLNFCIDQYDFNQRMILSRDDFLLLARGQLWLRYIPHEPAPGPAGAAAQEAEAQVTSDQQSPEIPLYAEVATDHLGYDDFGMGPCRYWAETPFVYRWAYMDRAALKERFGKKLGAKIPLDWQPKGGGDDVSTAERKEKTKKARIAEVWDKVTRQVYWVSLGYTDSVLDQRDPPMDLAGFFPCPRPLMGSVPPDNYIPIPDYVYYQDQALELDELTQRIAKLTDALRMVGVYDASCKGDLASMFNGTENTLIPVESMAQFADKGGMKGIIQWMPIKEVADTLGACFETRARILEDIYQITGISDIVRGDTDPNETATAQDIKSQWGALRVRDRQKELARFARDVLEIKAEIIAKYFPVDTLKAMTGIKLLTAQEKAQAQQAMQAAEAVAAQAQQAGAPPEVLEAIKAKAPGEDVTKLLSLPSWEDVDGLLKNDALRSFRIDIETDSTIEPNEGEEKARRVEFMGAFTQLLGAALPLLEKAPQAAPMVGEAVKFLVRGFRVGREMEDVVEKTFAALANMPPAEEGQKGDPYAPQVAATELETEKIKQQGELEQKRIDQAMQTERLPYEAAEIQAQQYALARDRTPQGSANGPNGAPQ